MKFVRIGKSTTAQGVHNLLKERGAASYWLDGDILRKGLSQDLGFSAADRKENNRRMAEVASLMVDAGLVTIVASISPYRAKRDELRGRFMSGKFVEIYVDAPISLCERPFWNHINIRSFSMTYNRLSK